MTRFDAERSDERRALFIDGIAAQRERGVGFLTVEVDVTSTSVTQDDREENRPEGEPERQQADEASGLEPPWIQFTEGRLNLDCTDAELDRLATLLDRFPAFTVEERTSPENAEGTNVRVSALVDDERVAAFIDETFRHVYERPEEYRAWVATV